MTKFVVRRLIYSVVVVFAIMTFVFFLSRLSGDPRELYLSTVSVSKDTWESWGREMGLDKPLATQYLIWVGRAVRGDFGNSVRDQVDAKLVVLRRIPATAQLATSAFLLSIVVGLPLGVLSALRRETIWDYGARFFALFGQALPAFWVGIVLVLIFSVELRWLPTGRRGDWTHYILPSVTLGWYNAAAVARLVRSSMLDVLDSEYVRFARAKGVDGRIVIWKHAFRNSMIPPLTYAGVIFAAFLTGHSRHGDRICVAGSWGTSDTSSFQQRLSGDYRSGPLLHAGISDDEFRCGHCVRPSRSPYSLHVVPTPCSQGFAAGPSYRRRCFAFFWCSPCSLRSSPPMIPRLARWNAETRLPPGTARVARSIFWALIDLDWTS